MEREGEANSSRIIKGGLSNILWYIKKKGNIIQSELTLQATTTTLDLYPECKNNSIRKVDY